MNNQLRNRTKLKKEQLIAIDMLLKGARIFDIAMELRIHSGTIYNWFMTDPVFVETYTKMRQVMEESDRNLLAHHARHAVWQLAQLMNDRSESVSLQASVNMIRLMQMSEDQTDLERITDELRPAHGTFDS